jgi:uncharacterized membrane protein
MIVQRLIGCPVCSTELGEQVRAGIFGVDFGFNLFAVILPFAVLALAIVALDRAVARTEGATRRKEAEWPAEPRTDR